MITAHSMDSTVRTPLAILGALALRRLHHRLVNPEASACFLEAHRESMHAMLERAVHRALLAIEMAVQNSAFHDHLAGALPNCEAKPFLHQLQSLRDSLVNAGLDCDLLGDMGECMHQLRASGSISIIGHFDWADDDEEAATLGALAAHFTSTGHRTLAQLFVLSGPYSQGHLVGLVDYLGCRALLADPVVGSDFVYVHLEQPNELWHHDLDEVARHLEKQSERIARMLDGNVRACVPDATIDAELEHHFQLGLDCYRGADYQKAIAHFTAAMRHAHACFPLFAYRGDAHRLACNYENAITDYTAALKLDSRCANVLVQRANVYRLQGNARQAVRDSSAALEIDTDYAPAYLNRADAHAALGQYDDAIADYDAVIRLQPRELWGYFGRGKVYLEKGNLESAVADYSRVLRLNPHYVPALMQRGEAHRRRGDLSGAILDFTEIVRHHPRNSLAYRGRAQARELAGELDQAITDYSLAIRLDPRDTAARCGRGALYRRKGDLQRALSDLNEAIHDEPSDAAAYYQRGLTFLAQHQAATALADFNAALDHKPTLMVAYLGRALAHDRLKQFSQGIQSCGRALEVANPTAAPYLVRGVISSHAGAADKAIADMTRAAELDPKFSLTYQERGLVYLSQGDHERAGADFSQMIELEPTSPDGFVLRGTLRQLTGETDAALADFGQALKLDPKALLTGYHASADDRGHGRTTQRLVDYFEGISVPRRIAVRRRRKPLAPTQDEATQEFPITPTEEAIQEITEADVTVLADDTAQTGVLQAAETAEMPAAPETPVTSADDTEAALAIEAADVLAEPTEARAPEPPPTSASDPLQPFLMCPRCHKSAKPYVKLPDDQVRCGNCQEEFFPARSYKHPRLGSASPPKLSKPKPAKATKSDPDDEPGVTRKQQILIGSAVFVLGVLTYFYFPSFGTSGAEGPAPIKASADELLQEFTVNPAGAAKKYSGGPVVVTGEVAEIFADKRPRIRFKRSDHSRSYVEAVVSHPDELKKIQKEKKITLRGECDGWQGNVVEITLCKVVAGQEKE